VILYTPMQLELVLEGFDSTKYPEYKEVDYNGVSLLVEDDGFGAKKIVKLLSTRPSDYLRLDLMPGSLLKS